MSTHQDNLALLRFPQLAERNIVRNRMTLKRWMERASDPFPRPVRLGPNSIGWRLSDVQAWLERQALKSNNEVV